MQASRCSAALDASATPARSTRALALALALLAVMVWPTGALAESASQSAGALTETITFKQPRVTGLARFALKRFAQKIAPSRGNPYRLEHVDIDVYVNPASDDFTRTAAANMGNEVARRLARYGVPRDRISYSREARTRADTRRGVYDVELTATGANR